MRHVQELLWSTARISWTIYGYADAVLPNNHYPTAQLRLIAVSYNKGKRLTLFSVPLGGCNELPDLFWWQESMNSQHDTIMHLLSA